jgi:hypothetical protein
VRVGDRHQNKNKYIKEPCGSTEGEPHLVEGRLRRPEHDAVRELRVVLGVAVEL